MLPKVPRQLSCALLLAGMLSWAQAAELGDAVVKSYLAQPMIADIELTNLTEDDYRGVQVKIANPDVFRGGNITMHPLLASLRMTTFRRDKQIFLHITSIAPVEVEYLHMFLELTSGKQSIVRHITLWFTKDPRPPAPPPPPEPEPVPEPKEELPSPGMLAAVARAALQSMPRPMPTGDSCARDGKACAVLVSKNAELNAHVVALEAKVKTLQTVIDPKGKGLPADMASASASAEHVPDAASAHAAASASASAAVSAGAKALPMAASKASASKPKLEKKPDYMNWVWIGSGVAGGLALIGGLIFFLRKRKKAAKAGPSGPGFMAKVLGRLRRNKDKGAAIPPHQEPKIE